MNCVYVMNSLTSNVRSERIAGRATGGDEFAHRAENRAGAVKILAEAGIAG